MRTEASSVNPCKTCCTLHTIHFCPRADRFSQLDEEENIRADGLNKYIARNHQLVKGINNTAFELYWHMHWLQQNTPCLLDHLGGAHQV